MATLAEASLTHAERELVERAVTALRQELGDDLISVWLYGSRARGEPPHPESDVDLLVLSRGGTGDRYRVHRVVWDLTVESRFLVTLSARVFDLEWLRGRREIEDFFIQEVDRDKIVLFGQP